MLTVPFKQMVASVAFGLGLAALTFTAPMTDEAHAAAPKRFLTPATGYTIKDMHGCIPSGSNSQFICYGPDDKTYVCTASGPCTKLDW
jgi:hypothetical protein